MSKLEGPSFASCSLKLFAAFSFIAGCSDILLMLFVRPLTVLHSVERRIFGNSCLFRQCCSLQVLGLILCLVEKYPYHFPATFILDFLRRFGLSLGPNVPFIKKKKGVRAGKNLSNKLVLCIGGCFLPECTGEGTKYVGWL